MQQPTQFRQANQRTRQQPNGTPPPAVKIRDNNVPIARGSDPSKSNKRRCIELANGVSALLISWTNSEQQQGCFDPSSYFVCVSLNIGRLHDPPDCLGLAELCQRLTLSGSRKYPNDEHAGLLTSIHRPNSTCSEDEQHQEMQGSPMLSESFESDHVACIDVTDDQTVYTFTLGTQHRAERVLDRIAAGLLCPLFSKAAIERELHVWQRLSCANHPSLMERLERCSGNPNHPYNRQALAAGRTIDKITIEELRNRIKEFHSKNYTANLLRVVVSCEKTLDEMEKMVLESLGGMPNLSLKCIRFDRHPYDGSEMAVKVRIKGKTLDGVHIVFALPDQAPKYLSSPDLFLTFLMHVDERGGLQDCLQRFGLGYCQCRLLPRGNLGFDSYCIVVKQSCKVRDAENRAITSVFRYLAMLRTVSINELQRREICRTHESACDPFSLNEFGPPQESLPRRLLRYPLRDLLIARFQISNAGSNVFVEFVSRLTPDRCRIFVSDLDAKEKAGTTGTTTIGSKPDERIQYTLEKIPPELLSACAANWPSKSEFDTDFVQTPIGPNRPQLTRPHRFLPWKAPAEFASMRSQPPSSMVKSRCTDVEAPESVESATRCCSLELTNGVHAFLLQRESLDNKSFICISLGVGRMHDPQDCQGLAQLCQRLTLLESKKYPNIVECFHNLLYINSYQGSPFYTMSVSDDQTTYRFDMDNAYFYESLDRLSAGILHPEFTESSINREQNQNYYRCKISSLDFLQRSSGNPTHPYNKWMQGSEKTIGSLRFKDLHSRLVDFHSHHYSANSLRLAFSSSHSIDDMQAMVLTTFGGMQNLSLPQLSCHAHPFDGSRMGVKVRSKFLSLGGTLHIVFPIRDQTEVCKTSPDLYVSHLLNSDYTGSLNSCKDQLKLGSISAGLQNTGSLGFDSFCVTVLLPDVNSLTKSELIATENNAITAVFRYLTMLRQLKPQEWLFNMVRFAQRKRFSFDHECEGLVPGSEKLDLLQGFCDLPLQVHLQRYPTKELLTARSGTMPVYSSQEIAALLRALVPEKCKIFVSDFEVDADHECSILTPDGSLCCKPKGETTADLHTLEALTPELLAACTASWPAASIKVDALIKPPKQNLFVCTDFQLKSREKKFESSGPQQLLIKLLPNSSSFSGARLWFCQDGLNSFKTPHAFISVDLLTSPGPAVTDCRSSIHLDYLVQLIGQHLQEIKELALEAELSLEISRNDNGIHICCMGYSQPLPLLLSAAMQNIREMSISESSFRKARAAVLSNLLNDEDNDVPELLQFLMLVLGASSATNWLYGEKHSAAKKVTHQSLLNFTQENYGHLFLRNQQQQQPLQKSPQKQPQNAQPSAPPRQLFAELLVYGNATASEAVAAAKQILVELSSQQSSELATSTAKPLSSSSWESLKSRARLLPAGSHHLLRLPSSVKLGMASSCTVAFQIVTPLTLKAAEKICQDFLLDLLVQILRHSINQHGIAGCGHIQLERMSGQHANIFVLNATSATLHPTTMDERIESHISRVAEFIDSVLDKKVDWKMSWNEMIRSKYCHCMAQQGSSYWEAISSSAYHFGCDTRSDSFRTPPDSFDKGIRKELIAFWQKFLKSEAPERRKLSIHKESKVKFRNSKDAHYAKYPGKAIKDPIEFRESLEQCPPAPSEILNSVHEV